MKNRKYTDIAGLIKNHSKHTSEEGVRTAGKTNTNKSDSIHPVEKKQKKKTRKLLNNSLWWVSLATILLIVAFLSIFYLVRENSKKVISQSRVSNPSFPAGPRRLIIPKINIDADVEYVGVSSSGAMEAPSNISNVGWFKLGPPPGEKGSAVIDGHLDGANGEVGVFANLYKLKKGDKLYIENSKGTLLTFVVQGSRIYDPGYADDVFSSSDSAHLNLITCDGVWDRDKKSYSKRLVVFTDFLH